jgi:hypothetical protein
MDQHLYTRVRERINTVGDIAATTIPILHTILPLTPLTHLEPKVRQRVCRINRSQTKCDN